MEDGTKKAEKKTAVREEDKQDNAFSASKNVKEVTNFIKRYNRPSKKETKTRPLERANFGKEAALDWSVFEKPRRTADLGKGNASNTWGGDF